MAMARSSSRRGRSNRPMAEINVVPYIDVMLVLLIIFMITAPLVTQGVKVDLPQADSQALDEDAKRPLLVSVDKNGDFFITYDDDKTKAVDEKTLLHNASAIISLNKDIPVLVKGDSAVDYGQVIRAMVILQAAGAPSVGLMTEPFEEK